MKPATSYAIYTPGELLGRLIEFDEVGTSHAPATKEIIEALKTPDPGYGKVEGVVSSDTIVIFQQPESSTLSSTAAASKFSTYLSETNTYTIDMGAFIVSPALEKVDARSLTINLISGEEKNSQLNFTEPGYKPFQTIVPAGQTEKEEFLGSIVRETQAASPTEVNNNNQICMTSEVNINSFVPIAGGTRLAISGITNFRALPGGESLVILQVDDLDIVSREVSDDCKAALIISTNGPMYIWKAVRVNSGTIQFGGALRDIPQSIDGWIATSQLILPSRDFQPTTQIMPLQTQVPTREEILVLCNQDTNINSLSAPGSINRITDTSISVYSSVGADSYSKSTLERSLFKYQYNKKAR